MTRHEIHQNFIDFMERERTERGWTIDRMAEALQLPPSTYRNIIYQHSGTIDIELACRLFDLTGKWMYQMTGYSSTAVPVVNLYTALTPENQKIIKEIYEVIYHAQEEN